MGQLLQGTGTGSHAECQELNDFESRAALAFQSTHQVGLRCGQSGRAAKLAVFLLLHERKHYRNLRQHHRDTLP